MKELHEKYGNLIEHQICERLSLVGLNLIDAYSFENIIKDTNLTKNDIIFTYSGYEVSENVTLKIYDWLMNHDAEFKAFLCENNDSASYKPLLEIPITLNLDIKYEHLSETNTKYASQEVININPNRDWGKGKFNIPTNNCSQKYYVQEK